jgi:peptidoglycan/xylan/chitin deacetylase (PgdA/CDA1 family)
MFRIVVYTAAAQSFHVTRTISAIVDRFPDVEILVLNHRPARPIGKLIRNQVRNLRRHGWRWLPYQASELLHRPPAVRDATSTTAHDRVTVTDVASVNAAEAVELVRAWEPDLGLSLAAPILRERQFTVPRLGTLNIHKGKLPTYRGMPPAFWELWHGETEVGVTVHRVEAGLDTGDILLESSVPILPFSTPDGLRVQLDELGVKLIAEAVGLMRSGIASFRAQTGEGRTNTRPTLREERLLAKRIQPFDGKRAAKNVVFTGYGIVGRYAPAHADRTVIFLYHRVNDRYRDAVTIGIEQFATHIRYLRDHYDIVTIEDLIDARDEHRGPKIAVTFDDGYLDNYQNAAPILVKYGVPATFFISTDHIALNSPFDHDLRKLGEGLPNMSWDQVREMRDAGLSFGSHTANHINLAKSDAALVEEELRRSKEALQRELGLTRVMFAHPFGKRSDITAERLQQVKDAGYICNCSAYGGVNGRVVDRWDVRRQGIDHSFDTPALRAKIAGWKATSYA